MNAQNPAVCFNKIDDEFGGFLNKADGYPVVLNGIHIPSVEHLYHALKFPDHPSGYVRRQINRDAFRRR
jgi:hypothetical protein